VSDQSTIMRIPVTFSDGTIGTILPEGTRVRHRQHPGLTGYIKHWEYNRSIDRGDARNILSPIPYCIGWDDSERAYRTLGFMFVYPHPDNVLPMEQPLEEPNCGDPEPHEPHDNEGTASGRYAVSTCPGRSAM
jgi:hypothetical protein